MKSYNTRYGTLTIIDDGTTHNNGSLKDATLHEEVELITPYGTLIPQYEFTDHRKKYIESISFYENGMLRRISLNDKTEITTPIGTMFAELVTFYESGSIKRVFPLNGKLSAYWEEEDEYLLAKEASFQLPFGKIKAKVIAISFYENGAIKDFTFWPKEIILVQTPIVETRVRIGMALYPDGSIKSVEPAFPIDVNTPIGKIKAYDFEANGICGDQNSLNFTREGELESLITSGTTVTVCRDNMDSKTYSPEQEVDVDGLEVNFIPLKIEFQQNGVCFNDEMTYDIQENSFILEPYRKTSPNKCSDCSSCSQGCKKD